jgi:hypothetical protein
LELSLSSSFERCTISGSWGAPLGPLVKPRAPLAGLSRITEYEKISPTFLAKEGNEFIQETFVGEQAVVLNAGGKDLVVLSFVPI